VQIMQYRALNLITILQQRMDGKRRSALTSSHSSAERGIGCDGICPTGLAIIRGSPVIARDHESAANVPPPSPHASRLWASMTRGEKNGEQLLSPSRLFMALVS